MNKNKIFILLGFFFLYSLTIPLLVAQEKKVSIGLNVGLGRWTSDVLKYIRAETIPSVPFPYTALISDRSVDLKPHYNLNFQYNFSPRFGIQAEIGKHKANYMILFLISPLSSGFSEKFESLDVSLNVTTIFLNAIFRAPRRSKKIAPFFFIGLGSCYVQGKKDQGKYVKLETVSEVELGLKAGGGLTIDLSKSLPIGLNIRAFLMVLGREASYGIPTPNYFGGGISEGGSNIIWGIDTGLKYSF